MPKPDLRLRMPYLVGVVVAAGALLVGRFLRESQVPIPGCTFLRLTNFPCPFCGTTRSFFESAKGAVGEAFAQAPLGVLVYGATWLLLGWCLYRSARPPLPHGPGGETPLPRLLVYGALALILANWVYRLAMGYK